MLPTSTISLTWYEEMCLGAAGAVAADLRGLLRRFRVMVELNLKMQNAMMRRFVELEFECVDESSPPMKF